jgi:hypothetical protein
LALENNPTVTAKIAVVEKLTTTSISNIFVVDLGVITVVSPAIGLPAAVVIAPVPYAYIPVFVAAVIAVELNVRTFCITGVIVVKPVPPFATGNTPVTCVVNPTLPQDGVVPDNNAFPVAAAANLLNVFAALANNMSPVAYDDWFVPPYASAIFVAV